MVDVTTGISFLNSLGLPQILLWVLTFAIVYGILSKIQIFKGKSAPALISIIVGLFVLLAVPDAMIGVIANMSSSLIIVAIGFLVVLALIEIAGAKSPVLERNEKNQWVWGGKTAHPFQVHGSIVAIALILVAAFIFWVSGGAALIGFTSLPSISMGAVLLVIIGIAVVWMLSEKHD